MAINKDIERVAAELAAQNNISTEYIRADMCVPEDIRAMVAATEKRMGPVDILINNAGVQFVAPLEQFPDEMWDKVIATNLSSVFHATKAVLPSMKARGYGRVVNIASAHGLVASHNKSAYVAAKHGVVGFTKTVALETATTHGVTVNAVCPGFVLTPLVQAQIDARARERGVSSEVAAQDLLTKHPSGEFVTVEDLGNLVAFVCSPYTNQLTGQALTMDAGWTAQ